MVPVGAGDLSRRAEAVNIREAIASIIGERLAAAIIADQGIHWAVVAAMAEAETSDDPNALAAINAWRVEQKLTAEVKE